MLADGGHNSTAKLEGGGIMYLVLGIEPFKQLKYMERTQIVKQQNNKRMHFEKIKNSLCCQRYEVKTLTEVKKKSYLYLCSSRADCHNLRQPHRSTDSVIWQELK